MGWNHDNVTADDVGARRTVDMRRRPHRLAALTFITAFLVSATVAGLTAHAGTAGMPSSPGPQTVRSAARRQRDRHPER